MRVPHILQRNKNNETVHHAIWFDTETKPKSLNAHTISHQLWFGWACYKRRQKNGKWSNGDWIRFETREMFWDWVSDRTRDKTKLWLFCHNTAFDLPVLDAFRFLANRGFTLSMAIVESPPTVLQYRRATRTITLCDTLNIWRVPLKAIGEQIDLPKLEMPDISASQDEWDTYGKRDTEIIMKACILWWDMLIKMDFGGFAPTLAAQAMRTYRHKYMKHEIFIDTNDDALTLSRSGYHGGRTEAHFVGKAIGKFILLDVNSMYPHIMANTPVPIRIVGFTRRASVDDLRKWIRNACVVAEVRLKTDHNFAPLRLETKLLFPTGRFTCILSTPEIAYALEHDFIESVEQVAVYESAIAFKDYMDDIWTLRIEAILKGDMVLAGQLKTLVNAFYGKWGQSGVVWAKCWNTEDRTIKHWLDIDVESGDVTKWRQFAGIVQRKTDTFESCNSFPAIAAHITAAARMKLYALMQQAGLSNVLYCDTDSLLVNELGAANLANEINPALLGKLKIEGLYDHIRIWGAKDYIFGTKQRLKGIRKNAVKLGPNLYQQDRWVSMKGLLQIGITDQALTTKVNKQLRRTYEKGVIQADGRVLPFHYF